MSRVRAFGQAVGEYFRGTDRRVLFIGSGGLSHDPPVPQYATATDAQREFLTAGRHPTAEARAARQANTIATARRFAAGEADIMDLNRTGTADSSTSAGPDVWRTSTATPPTTMDAAAGHSSHEVRTWLVAAYSALHACGTTP